MFSHQEADKVLETDGMALRSEVSAAIVGGNDLGPVVVPSGFALYTVHDGKIDAGRFFRLDPR